MTKEQIQEKAYQLYAALGELGLRRKQLSQQIQNLDKNIESLEIEVVNLSKINTQESDNE